MFAKTFLGLKALVDGAVGTGCLARPPICIIYPERCQLGLTDSFVRALSERMQTDAKHMSEAAFICHLLMAGDGEGGGNAILCLHRKCLTW